MSTEWQDSTVEGVITSCDYGLSCGLSTDPAGVPILRMGNLQGGRVMLDDLKYAPREKVLEQHLLRPGDLLLNRTNSIDLVGKVGLFRDEKCVTFASYLFRIRTDPSRAVPEWLVQVLHSPTYQAMLRGIATPGVSQANINRERLRALPLLVPPLGEQRRIAAIVSSVVDAIEATQTVIDQLGVVKQAMMAELLTRGLPRRHTRFKQTQIGEIPEQWELRRLPEVTSWQNGRAFPSADYATSGVRLVRPGNLAAGGVVLWDEKHTTHLPPRYAEEHPSFLVGPGELLMNLTAQSLEEQFLGRVCATPEGPPCLLNQRIARIVPKTVDSRYLQWALSGPQFRAHLERIPKGSKVMHIYNADLESALIPVPSLEEQRSIGRLVDAVQDRSATEEALRVELEVLKRGLLSVLITGEVRVRPDHEAA